MFSSLMDMNSHIPDHQTWEYVIILILLKIWAGILDHQYMD